MTTQLFQPKPGSDLEQCLKPFDHYPGSKDAAGAAERTIRLIPDHSVYVEGYLGGGAILRRKRPALRSIGIDKDPKVIREWERVKFPGLELHLADAIPWLAKAADWLPPDALVNLDPPYVHSTRGKGRAYKQNEMTDEDHLRLLAVAAALPCSVILHGYASALYDDSPCLKNWKREQFQVQTRGGPRTEVIWFKISLSSFHIDRRYVGTDFRDRERIKRLVNRWTAKFDGRPPAEKTAILQALIERYATVNPEDFKRLFIGKGAG